MTKFLQVSCMVAYVYCVQNFALAATDWFDFADANFRADVHISSFRVTKFTNMVLFITLILLHFNN